MLVSVKVLRIRVTPYVGVWIETLPTNIQVSVSLWSHPTWVCGLKQFSSKDYSDQMRSHPTWVCGLKQCQWKSFPAVQLSHPTWVCGLKHGCVIYINCMRSHTLRGCVD